MVRDFFISSVIVTAESGKGERLRWAWLRQWHCRVRKRSVITLSFNSDNDTAESGKGKRLRWALTLTMSPQSFFAPATNPCKDIYTVLYLPLTSGAFFLPDMHHLLYICLRRHNFCKKTYLRFPSLSLSLYPEIYNSIQWTLSARRERLFRKLQRPTIIHNKNQPHLITAQ